MRATQSFSAALLPCSLSLLLACAPPGDSLSSQQRPLPSGEASRDPARLPRAPETGVAGGVKGAQGPTAPAAPRVSADGFILGIQWGTSTPAAWLNELGVEWTRGTLSWRSVQPVIDDDTLTFEDVENSPWMIDEFLETADWSWADRYLRDLNDAGIQVIPVVGLGWEGCLPSIDGEIASPDRLGADTYLAYMYLYVRATVERYDGDGDRDAPGIVIDRWQIENELNQAMLTTLYGWREPTGPAGLSSLWADWDFLTQLLYTLNRAVHESDPDAITIQNLHTDVPEEYNHFFRLPGWIEAARLWKDYMDVIGFDAYPNYYYSDPIQSDVIAERVEILKEAGGGKPVIIMESGYPSGPEELGYSREKQAQYLEEAVHAAIDAGAAGYFHFKLEASETHSVVLTEEDKRNLKAIGMLFEQGRVGVLLGWVVRNADYVPHMLDVLKAVEGYWGLVTPEGERKPSFYTMQRLAAEVNGTP